MKLLTTLNHKTSKNLKFGYLSAALHLQPNYRHENENTCPDAGKCLSYCLVYSGRNKYDYARSARMRRTDLFFMDRKAFIRDLKEDIQKLWRSAQRKGLNCSVRLNALSDLPWEQIDRSVFDDFPYVQFIDYTRNTWRMFCGLPANYFLCYSTNENTPRRFLHKVIDRGFSFSFIYPKKLPETYWSDGYTFRVADGDLHDLRHLDAKHAIALKFKEVYRPNTGYKLNVENEIFSPTPTR